MKKHNYSHRLLLSITGLALVGCAVGPSYQAPVVETPAAWLERPAVPAEIGVELGQWWMSFKDPTLARLIEQAAAANHDLRMAAGRLREARARFRGAGANRAPQLGASGKAVHQRSSENGPQGRLPQANLEGDIFESGFDASWELDLFGFVRQGVEVAATDVEAAREAGREVLVSLLAEVGRDYVQLRSLQQRSDLTHRNLRAQQETLDLVRVRFAAGLAADPDVARAEALVAGTRAQIPFLEAQVAQTIYRLSILVGREPTALLAELAKPEPLPEQALAAGIPLGLPSELLRRRPDVRAAERQLAASSLRKGVAAADLYPRFFLTGATGLQSTEASDFFTAGSRLFSIGPTVRWNVFDFGRVRANIAVQDARVEQLLAAYEKSILTALAEVESSLIALDREVGRRQALTEALAANQRALTTSFDLYRQGLTTYLAVLDSQRQVLLAEDQLIQSRAAVLTGRVGLYKALGGGWAE